MHLIEPKLYANYLSKELDVLFIGVRVVIIKSLALFSVKR